VGGIVRFHRLPFGLNHAQTSLSSNTSVNATFVIRNFRDSL
jgi:hypothetical protein